MSEQSIRATYVAANSQPQTKLIQYPQLSPSSTYDRIKNRRLVLATIVQLPGGLNFALGLTLINKPPPQTPMGRTSWSTQLSGFAFLLLLEYPPFLTHDP